MAAGRLNEEQLMDELLGDDDTEDHAHEGSPPKRPKSGRHHRHHSSKGASADRLHPESPAAAEERSQGAAGSGLAAEAAAVFSRLSASSSDSPVGARAAAEAAAAFAVGDGPAQPPGTIHPGASLAPSSPTSAASAADLQRLHDRQWDWALAVHGSEDAAMAAGFKPKDEPDYALYSVYMGRVRKCLDSPDVEDPATEAGAQLLRMVLAFRAYMACLYASGTFVMEHRYSNLETLSQLGELSAEVATLSGGRQQTAYRPKGKAAAISGPGSAGTHDSVTAHSKSDAAGGSQPCSGGANSIEGVAGASPAAGDATEGAPQPARSRRSESAPLVRRPDDLTAAGARHESPFSGDGPRSRRSLDLKPLSDNSATRPGAEKLKKAYRDRATMDVRPTIAAIKFSTQQRREVLQRRRELDTELERSQAGRKTLLARLQALTMRGGGAGRGWHCNLMDTSAALRGNLDAEGRVITDFSAWFTCRLLTPLQHARCNATCYPYMPDVIGISDVLAAEKQAF